MDINKHTQWKYTYIHVVYYMYILYILWNKITGYNQTFVNCILPFKITYVYIIILNDYMEFPLYKCIINLHLRF